MSSHLSGGLDLTPADLDRLEDALEDLELAELDELPADDLVAHRLSEYRQLLRLGREALPLEDVPTGLLDGVMAQARQAVAATPAAAAPAPSFWQRWRLGVWVPALAFAGSAALLLVVLVPKGADEPAASRVAQGEAPAAAAAKEQSKADAKAAPAGDGRLAYAEPEPAAAADEPLAEGAVRGGGMAIGERAPEPAPAEEQAAEAPADYDLPGAAAPPRQKVATGSSGADVGAKPAPKAPATSGASKPKGEPMPDPLGNDAGEKKTDAKPQKKDDAGGELWSEIERADADRRSGSCGLAKMRYEKLRKLGDARVRARALAGLGLCAAASDDDATAKKLFAQARAADSDVGSFIDRELAALDGTRSKAMDPARAD